MGDFNAEVNQGKRFQFGKNWEAFSSHIDESTVLLAQQSLQEYLGLKSLEGQSFLDIGSGSGLSSLAARRLGAKVYSFDFDPASVSCTRAVREVFFPGDPDWRVEEGSVLDQAFLEGLGRFDIVYSWGVLHHTGDLPQALENVISNVKEGGLLYIAIYNTQVYWTRFHTWLKKTYNRSPGFLKAFILAGFIAIKVIKGFFKDLLFLKNPLKRYRKGARPRGMTVWHDWIDWVGGYPFETAKPEEIFDFYHQRGFSLEKLYTAGGGLGCNEFVFRKLPG